MLSVEWVLSAAHCFVEEWPGEYRFPSENIKQNHVIVAGLLNRFKLWENYREFRKILDVENLIFDRSGGVTSELIVASGSFQVLAVDYTPFSTTRSTPIFTRLRRELQEEWPIKAGGNLTTPRIGASHNNPLINGFVQVN